MHLDLFAGIAFKAPVLQTMTSLNPEVPTIAFCRYHALQVEGFTFDGDQDCMQVSLAPSRISNRTAPLPA